jgi:hypothetical protein
MRELCILGFWMAVTHFVTAILAGLNRPVFQATGEALPPTFADIRASWRTSILHVCAAG